MDKLRVRKWLFDIKIAIEDITEFMGGRGYLVAVWESVLVRRAIERCLEIIGEATDRILFVAPDIEISAGRQIVDTRNYIAHQYDAIDESTIAEIVDVHLKTLLAEVEILLNGEFYDDDESDD